MRRRLSVIVATLLAAPAIANDVLPESVSRSLAIRDVPPESISIAVEDVESGERLLSFNTDVPRNPASTMKLLTTLVALDMLGPSYTWHTDVFIDGEVDEGRLDGDLVIRGRGDPFLVTERVWQMLRAVRQAGIHDIRGDLAIDDSWFDVGDYDPGAFDRQPLRAYNVAPNALLMNFKVVRYWFEPDFDRNAVRVVVDPPLGNLAVDNRLSLAAGSCRGYQRGITITPNEAIDKMTFSGRFPGGCERYAMDRTALTHNEFVYGLFMSLWRESGGRFDGGLKSVVVDDEREPLLSFPSLPLADVIKRVNKHSNNVMARQLLYTLSAEALGAPGTEAGGRSVIEDWLETNDFEARGIALDNGAGLSRFARTTAAEFMALLRFAWQQPYMPEYVASLALSGSDGTLRRRFDDYRLAGQAHLKTGSLDHVSAIAGYMQSRSGRRFAVVVLHNHEGIHRGPGEEAQTALLRWVYDH